jgi:hypothetical protein
MERKGAKKRDSSQSRKDKGKYCDFLAFQQILRSTEENRARGTNSHVLNVGRSPPFGLGITQIVPASGSPSYTQQPVYGNSFNNSQGSIPTTSEVRPKVRESPGIEENWRGG